MALMNLSKASLPTKKLLALGVKSLTDAELLGILLGSEFKEISTFEWAEQLLNEFGSLRKLLGANEQAFCHHNELGTATFVQLQVVAEITERYLLEKIEKENALTSPEQTKRYLTKILRDRHRESFYVLFLDNQHRVLKGEVLFEGTIDVAAVYPREVVKRSIDYNAAAIILAHNHPSGVAEPSLADKRITKRISDAVELVDIRVLDHFVIGDGEIVSFAERGWI